MRNFTIFSVEFMPCRTTCPRKEHKGSCHLRPPWGQVPPTSFGCPPWGFHHLIKIKVVKSIDFQILTVNDTQNQPFNLGIHKFQSFPVFLCFFEMF